MGNSDEQIFLALATKNNLMTRDQASDCLQACSASGKPIQQIVLEKGLLTREQVLMLAAATQKVRQGQTGTLRVQSAGPAPAAPANPNEPIPGYPIVGKLGVGGTATVFLAEDKKNGNRKVALKILKPALAKEPKSLKSFLREAELLTKFDHGNIVRAYDYGSAGPLTFMVLEFLEGHSVFDEIEQQKSLSESRALEIILEAGKALAYVQAQGIVHRDIKPDNLMLTKDARVVLCDLGFAIPIHGGAEEQALAEEETTSGTVQYMSPEQARGATDLDVRTDIYSLGATLYHMIMGEVPFAGSDSSEVMAKQVLEALNSSEIKNRRISRHMHYFIERMMSKDKDLRYATPEELVEDINAQIEGFKSLEYRPEEAPEAKSEILGGIRTQQPPPKTRRMRQPISQRLRKPSTERKRSPLTERLKQTSGERKIKPRTEKTKKTPDKDRISKLTNRFRRNR